MTEKSGVFHVVKANGRKHIANFGAASREVLHLVHARVGQGGSET